jgi:ribose 5-phosphate isomerase RpiB
MVAEWLDRPFEERHQRRLDKIAEIESSFRGR